MMSDDEFLQPGRTFDGFQLVERLGEGAMGAVWKAAHLKLKRPVAIKFLKRDAAKTENARNRFLREGEAAARVRHPHVVEVFDVGVANGAMPYIVMELLDGEELRGLFRRTGPMPVAALVDLLVPVCAAVAAAHDEGVVHRDLKPENIFLARTRDRVTVPKVVDFGISRVSDDDSGRVNTGTVALMGTPRYMSPEQVQGAKHVDARTDQYALGVILYEGSTGEAPIQEAVLYALFQRVVAGQYQLPRALRPDLSPAFEAVILRAMATHPDLRFPTVRALGRALLPFASERTRLLFADRLLDVAGTLPELPRADEFAPPEVASASSRLAAAAPMSTLGESVRELPADTFARPSRGVSPVLLAGLTSLGLVAAAVAVVLVRPMAPPPLVRPSHPTTPQAASTSPAPTSPAPPAAPAHPRAQPQAATASAQAPALLPAATARTPVASAPTPPPVVRRVPHGTGVSTNGSRVRRGRLLPLSSMASPASTAPVFRPPTATTRSGAAID